ncbi:uncharacterized protein A1O9_05388 [Exophiala aquamarina CBS 119918]|uniref:Lysine-specific metallo-endopeptidase domain-containing protein n=1 Tax=Exophiala aquamarina CBS 119918 TaxID=1182545 RepID=A0A072PC91_9EURO|nr:uncharacterized protein A1O9_05388 [Exophiala aquamarina CBS 119918]KEF57471.1 hypothetical protein A1O9_05388 [Exophiala aquamarina CBS 119918]
MHILIQVLVAFALKVLAQYEDLPPELATTAYPDLNDTNLRGTWLWGFNGCDKVQTANIKEAYDDFKTLSNTKGVLSNIDWNSAAALEYLGPPGFNKNQQKQIQAVFANAATNPPPQTPNPSLNAYSLNSDPDDPNWPMINFCKPWFEKRSLGNAYAFGSGQTGTAKFDITKYLNRAETMFHELLHLNNVADSVGNVPNPVVDDMTITYAFRASTGRDVTVEERAYGATRSKLLARFKPEIGDLPTGYYVQRNADNLVFYALAKYTQEKLGAYPHMPVIREFKLTLPPFKKPNPVIEYKSIDNKAVLLDELDIEPVPGCNDRLDDASPTSLTLGTPYDDSEYPSDYRIQMAQWVGALSDTPALGQPFPPRCQSDVLTDAIYSTSLAEAADKVQQYCSNKAWWEVNIVPAVTFGDGSGHKALGVSDNFTVNGSADKLCLDVSWKPGCMGSSLFTVGATDGDKKSYCTTRFLAALNGCDTSSTDKKYGGGLVDNCLVYRIGAVAADADVPFTVFTGGPEFSCTDGDASFDPSFSNACSCFYTGEPETVALFDKPDGGCPTLTKPPAMTFQEVQGATATSAAKRDYLGESSRTHPRDVTRRV